MIEHTPWKVGTDLFAARHVYDAGGDRLTNQHRSGGSEWDKICHLIAAAPDLLEALESLLQHKPAFRTMPLGAPNSHARQEQDSHIAAEDQARAAIAKARGESDA